MKTAMKRFWAALLCAALIAALCACGAKDGPEQEPEEDAPQINAVSASLPGSIGSLDPFYCVSQGGETVLLHLYENLMRWVDGGDGWAVAAPGQAESYTVETDLNGNATYTFTLREGLVWSDGTPVTASDFVSAWQTLADPDSGLPHRELMACIAGYVEDPDPDGAQDEDDAQAENEEAEELAEEVEDVSQLAVSAPDERTFVVTLKGNPAYFLEEVCASAYTVPRIMETMDGSVTNGPYTASEADAIHAVLVRSESYYAPEEGGPDEIRFYTAGEADYEYQQLQEGGRDLITTLPESVLRELADSGLWTPEPVSATYGVLLNTLQAPFDNANVRLAFHLAIDRQTVLETLGDVTARPAPGIVPYGVSDYSSRPVVEAPVADDSLPDPITGTGPEPEKPAPTCWDYRTHALDVVTAEHTHEYETDYRYAQALLAQAGYPGGNGFPAVEFLYVNRLPSDRIVAGQLQKMWKECLGVTVTVREVSQEVYDAALVPVLPEEEEDEEVLPTAAFQMAAQSFSPVYSDALALLEQWHSESPDNVTGYASDSFDILIHSAQGAVAADARDAYLHDAEAILLSDSPVIPVLCRGGSYQLREGLEGLYRAADGVFFLGGVHEVPDAG